MEKKQKHIVLKPNAVSTEQPRVHNVEEAQCFAKFLSGDDNAAMYFFELIIVNSFCIVQNW